MTGQVVMTAETVVVPSTHIQEVAAAWLESVKIELVKVPLTQVVMVVTETAGTLVDTRPV